jgi:ligand-binding SRPBCC domain-containing protein
MRVAEFTSEIWLPRARDEVFAFFADAGNLERLTPPLLSFSILTPRPIAMRPGTLIDYRLKVRGIPIRWRSEITVWEPPVRFVDEQRKGPYRLWHHTHEFAEQDGGTLWRSSPTASAPCASCSGRRTPPGRPRASALRWRRSAPAVAAARGSRRATARRWRPRRRSRPRPSGR